MLIATRNLRRNYAVFPLLFGIIFPAFFVSVTGLPPLCPTECACKGHLVDCSRRGLTYIPQRIPETAERLILDHNNITRIGATDLNRLRRLTKLSLRGNQIYTIHQNAFEGLGSLRFLYLDNNNLFCIHENTFRPLPKLQSLALNNNNISYISERTLSPLRTLVTLRLHSNPLHCDCNLAWLGLRLRRFSYLGVFTRCQQPPRLRGVDLRLVPIADFTCSASLSTPLSCSALSCPPSCSCENHVIDCRRRGLISVPFHFPQDAEEIRMEGNFITEVPAMAFASYSKLKRIDLSNNVISQVGKGAFRELNQLTSLILYGNKIVSLPAEIFEDLESLQLLLLNANEIKCVQKNTFAGLGKLTLLSLYDNKLHTLPKGIFDSLKSLQVLHLGKNHFSCDCHMKWIVKFLRRKPIETSGVKCSSPASLSGKKISVIRAKRFRCLASNSAPYLPGECMTEVSCPKKCRCEDAVVDCSEQGLTSLPENIPLNAAELILSNNHIEVLKPSKTFKYLRNLKRIDLSDNQMRKIEPGAFEGGNSVLELSLNNNYLSDVHGELFTGLDNLKSLMLRNNRLTCIGNVTFMGLRTVTHLSLYSNRIAVVLEGAFESMTSLSTLNLLSNPLDCNCHLAWLSPWLRHRSVAAGNPRCEKPRFLKRFPVADINPRDFRCTTEEMTSPLPTCIPEKKCPKRCECSGTIVRCVNRGLTSLPIRDLPDDVTELYLERNLIRTIPTSIKRLLFLRTLDLSNNRLSTLSEGTFSNLTKLSTLLLSYNRIRCIHPGAFRELQSLKILNLHSNNLSTLPENIFSNLQSLLNVGLGANSWHCDCQLSWFAAWVRTGNFEAGIARCAGPQVMMGRLLLSAASDDFICEGPLDVAVASKCNPCLSSPCLYNSSCRVEPVEGYQCLCAKGFSGRNCDIPSNPCLLKPCRNGGNCRAVNEFTFICTCQPGFEGKTCADNIDDCASNPCYPLNSTCIDEVDSFSCKCAVGWTGTNCDRRVGDPCATQRPCLNGGTCHLVENIDEISYRCSCPPGFLGENCSERIEACVDHKCENGATCEADGSTMIGYRCHCRGDYRGPYCSFSLGSSVILSDDPCSQHDCLNGGQCHVPQGGRGYECRCLMAYSGDRCEKLTSISFHRNGSFVQLPNSLGRRDVNVTIILSTSQHNGILLYNGDAVRTREHLSVELYSGHIRISFDLGTFPGSKLYGEFPINDGVQHKIQIVIRERIFSFQLDNFPGVSRTLDGDSFSRLDIDTPTFVGGMNEEFASAAKTLRHVQNAQTFIGCIYALYMNNLQVNFSGLLPGSDDVTRDVRPGCVTEDRMDSCSDVTCVHGQCVFEEVGSRCKCDEGYLGKMCNEELNRSPCQDHRCVHGACAEQGSSYTCNCSQGYTGRYCEFLDFCSKADCGRGQCVITSSGYTCKCRKHYAGKHCKIRIRQCSSTRSRKFHEVRLRVRGKMMNCRSKRKITSRVCSGFCSRPLSKTRKLFGGRDDRSYCCKPLRTISKRIPVLCEDGRNRISTIEKVRRCVCLACT